MLFVISFFVAYHLPDNEWNIMLNFWNVTFNIMLFGGAVFFGGRAYTEMNSPAKSIEQLMIPASVFEKFIIPLLITSFGWLLFTTISFQVFVLITDALWSGLFHLKLGFYNVFEMLSSPIYTQALKFYFFTHSVFFLGATAFKKYAIAKTALATFIIQNGVNLLGLIFILILFGNLIDFGIAVDATFRRPEIHNWIENGGLMQMTHWVYWITALVLPIIFYVAAYFKVKEREV